MNTHNDRVLTTANLRYPTLADLEDRVCLLGLGGHDADVRLVDGFPRNLKRAATVGVAVFFALLGRVKVSVSEAAELALEYCPSFPLELVYHLQTSREGCCRLEIRIAFNAWGTLLCLRGCLEFDSFSAIEMEIGCWQDWRTYTVMAIDFRLILSVALMRS